MVKELSSSSCIYDVIVALNKQSKKYMISGTEKSSVRDWGSIGFADTEIRNHAREQKSHRRFLDPDFDYR